ncbi:MAG: DUF126 domain-containing protein [Pseudomonadota bacterium]
MNIQGKTLHEGEAAGPLLVLDEPLSFWGGFDPQTGEIIDRHHPQAGERAGGKILALTETRGSAGTPAGVAEAIRKGEGPAAIIVVKQDVNLVAGAMTAAQLYRIQVPVISIDAGDFARLKTGEQVDIKADGSIHFTP